MKKPKMKRVKEIPLRERLKLSEYDLEQISLILAEKIIRKAIDNISPRLIYFECRHFVQDLLDAVKYTYPAPKKKGGGK